MRYVILHESSNRMRLHIGRSQMTIRQADILESYLSNTPYIKESKIFERSGDVVIKYDNAKNGREQILNALCDFSYYDEKILAQVPDQSGRSISRKYQQKLVMMVLNKIIRSLFFPQPLKMAWVLAKSMTFVIKGLQTLSKGKLEVSVLDAAAIVASILRGDFATAGSVMFLLQIGELLEEWTYKKSVNDLAKTMSLKVDFVWKREDGKEDTLVEVASIKTGDHVVVRNSNIIPLDGKVLEGAATVNQASMTGESVPVAKAPGGYVYAGTVVEEGEFVFEVTKETGSGKYDQIVRMIEESEKLKSNTEAKAFHMADKLVPYSLAGAAVTGLATRNVPRALSFLMVDFSCALKLSMPLSVLSAIKEAREHDISVKGGKFMEAMAQADTIVFDKTGTLTRECPTVVDVIPFGGAEESEMVRVAACLEEHYPHSVANAVVKHAKEKGLSHEEMHTKVQYVVAHGISSTINDKKVVIGSHHFVFDDEGTVVSDEEKLKLESLPDQYTHLYLAIDGQLCAAICIEDPLREEAAEVVEKLHDLGFKKVCMMTGDNERTAAAVARKLHLDCYYSEVLPADKAAFIKREHLAGRKVVMIGDGVNDTPALSEADAGIAIRSGAAIANEVADIIISSDDLRQLLTIKELSNRLMRRIDSNYKFIIGFNAVLIGLGVFGVLTPATSALLHNSSTIISGLRSMTGLLPAESSSSEKMVKVG